MEIVDGGGQRMDGSRAEQVVRRDADQDRTLTYRDSECDADDPCSLPIDVWDASWSC